MSQSRNTLATSASHGGASVLERTHDARGGTMEPTDIEHAVEQRRTKEQRRRARNSHGLSTLLAAREELSGVSPVADFFVESVRWTA
jgi:hypothetical protein